MSTDNHSPEHAANSASLIEPAIPDYPDTHQEQARLAAIVNASDDAILSKTLDGIITTWNPAAERMFGYTAQEIIGQPKTILFPPDRLHEEVRILDRLRQGIATDHIETVRLHKNGTPVYLSITISPVKNLQGRVIGATTVARNITEQKRMYDALIQSEQWLQSALRAGNIGLWEHDLQSQRVRWSEETARMLGLPIDVLEVPFGEFEALIHPDDRAKLLQSIEDTIANRSFCEHEFRCIRPDGQVRWMQADSRAVYDSNGQALRLTGTQRDITQRMARIESEANSRAVVEAQSRVLEMIARGEPVEAVLDAVVQFTENQMPGAICSVLRLTGTRLWHGAASSLPEAYTSAIDGVTIGEGVGSCGTAVYRKEPVIVSDIATDPLWADYAALALAYNLRACWSWPVLASDGTVMGTFAMYYNTPQRPATTELACVRQAANLINVVLQRNRRDEALRQTEERFLLAMEGARDGLWDWNIDTGDVYFSPHYSTMLGYAENELRAHVETWLDLVHPDDLSHVQPVLQAYLAQQLDTYEVEFRMRHKEGSYRWILARGVALFNKAGQPYRMAGCHTDLTEKKRSEQQLKAVNKGLEEANALLEQRTAALEAINAHLADLATTDGLTSLKNHRAFQDRLHEEYSRTLRYHAPLSIVLLDVDNFKHFNDTYGHPAGDSVLKEVADILRRETRTADIVARYGGEEFVVILPETEVEGARVLAERMREAVAAAPWKQVQVTVSLGIATLTLLTSNPAALITEADKALYRSKDQGRNRATHFTDPLETESPDTRTLASFNEIVQTVLAGQGEMLLSASDQLRDMLIQSYDATIASWSRILDVRDKETEGHSERVTKLMVRLAEYLGMNAEEVMFARWGSWLHDIGKMAVPDHILHKPGPLTDAEWIVMRQHTTVALEMLAPIQFLGPALDIPYCHHEKWDGSGYPRGLKGDEIPMMARMFAVIDVYDALSSDRPYRSAWDRKKVLAYLEEQAGAHFDPRAVQVFLEMLRASEVQTSFAAP